VLSGFERVKESRDAMRASRWTMANPKCSPAPRWPSSTTTRQARAHHRIANPDAAPVRRPPPDLWSVFNRTQENLTKGGLHGRSANGRRQQTRPCRALIPMCA
jgi:hypothetical protein